jgi:hypothetical protein
MLAYLYFEAAAVSKAKHLRHNYGVEIWNRVCWMSMGMDAKFRMFSQ